MDLSLGLYIHIPFCSGKCAYCDFYSRAGCEEFMDPYCDALCQHITEAAEQMDSFIIDTVYFGGGTPSYFGADRLLRVLNTIRRSARLLVDSEVTLEANPESVSLSELIKLRKGGFNRISLGVQSSDDGILESIGRRHTFRQAEDAVKLIRKAGFKNLSLDLIYGLPSQTREGWADTLSRCLSLKPEHLSCYGLKIEPGTPLYLYRDAPYIPDDDMQADMYLYAVDTLRRHGYRQYEISNFAKKGMHSRHNLRYWTGGQYMGFGVAAHSYVADTRYSIISDLHEYIRCIQTGRSVIASNEAISRFEKASEYLMLGLRTTRGISEQEYQDIYPCSFDLIRHAMGEYVRMGLAMFDGDRWSLTPRGFLLSNTIISSVMEAQTRQRNAANAPWINNSAHEQDPQLSLFIAASEDVPLFRGI